MPFLRLLLPGHGLVVAMAPLLLWLSILLLMLPALAEARDDFEPYQVNGGLVSAVAAKDFVVIASDTRFCGEGGYDIVSRDHIASRLWMAGSDDAKFLLPRHGGQSTTKTTFGLPKQSSLTFVGSAGCSADCEALKRTIQAELRTASYFGECPTRSVDQVATLLSQVLYSRRTFPFYSFCVVAGLSANDDNDGGHVYVYDAIGSYEQVAVASSGTGRQLMQPILDRKFRTVAAAGKKPGATTMTMTTTVPTHVDCTAEEAVSILIDAYRSVSEREIQVGDNVVICVVQKKKSPNGSSEGLQCSVYKVPLKKH